MGIDQATVSASGLGSMANPIGHSSEYAAHNVGCKGALHASAAVTDKGAEKAEVAPFSCSPWTYAVYVIPLTIPIKVD